MFHFRNIARPLVLFLVYLSLKNVTKQLNLSLALLRFAKILYILNYVECVADKLKLYDIRKIISVWSLIIQKTLKKQLVFFKFENQEKFL